MVTWVLFVILLDADRYYVSPTGFFTTMDKCFEERSRTLATFPKPKINYEAVCVRTNKIKGAL